MIEVQGQCPNANLQKIEKQCRLVWKKKNHEFTPTGGHKSSIKTICKVLPAYLTQKAFVLLASTVRPLLKLLKTDVDGTK